MKLFYRASAKEILEARNGIFVKKGIPALQKNGFRKSPFSTAWFGRNNLGSFSYELCRLTEKSVLQIINVQIVRGDRWVQCYLNMFRLTPHLASLDPLNGLDGLHFGLPPNSISRMRLRSDDYKGIPLFYLLFGKMHKIGAYYSKRGFRGRLKALGELIEKDMLNIDSFNKRWYELHQPATVTWEGRTTSPE
jgi:hypothetical protein